MLHTKTQEPLSDDLPLGAHFSGTSQVASPTAAIPTITEAQLFEPLSYADQPYSVGKLRPKPIK